MMGWSFVIEVPWISLFIGTVLIFVLLAGWIWFERLVDPRRGTMDEADASAFVRGKCGDAMKISLRFSNDRVIDAKYWTDGCRMSSACGAAAAELCIDKTPEEIADIDYRAIERKVGGLAEEDRHCATLAADTVQEALKTHVLAANSRLP